MAFNIRLGFELILYRSAISCAMQKNIVGFDATQDLVQALHFLAYRFIIEELIPNHNQDIPFRALHVRTFNNLTYPLYWDNRNHHHPCRYRNNNSYYKPISASLLQAGKRGLFCGLYA